MNSEVITDRDRYPILTEDGRRLLDFMREHPNAPIFRNQSGNRLTSEDLERVRQFEQETLRAEIGWREGELPEWVADFVERSLSDVPFYRRYGAKPRRFQDLPAISRADLSRDIAQFVPDSLPIDRLINFRTSGTTGHGLLIASHPVVSASYLAFHKRALRRFGIELNYGRGQVGVVLVGYQRVCFTYVSVTPAMNESGLAKINLHPADWRNPDDRSRYLDALATEVYTGDPIAFDELLKLPLQTKPRVMLSTSMTLLPAMRQRLEERFGCPVLDIYSMNEAGPVAVADQSAGGHVLLQNRLYLEILNDAGQPLPAGQRGEVTLTGGFNPYLPLIRYRTGDYAALSLERSEPILVGLEGRPPVRFRNMRGQWFNNIEVTHRLRQFAIPQFTLRQGRDGSVTLHMAGDAHSESKIRDALIELFGEGQQISLQQVDSFEGKVVQYVSDLSW
jgi:phenylacetate-CoA ligase